MEKQLDSMDKKLDKISDKLDNHLERIAKLETNQKGIVTIFTAIFAALTSYVIGLFK